MDARRPRARWGAAESEEPGCSVSVMDMRTSGARAGMLGRLRRDPRFALIAARAGVDVRSAGPDAERFKKSSKFPDRPTF